MNAPIARPALPPIRPEAALAPTSGIVDVANYGRQRPGLIPLWVGEGDLATPAFICEAATRSLAAGETFYTWQRGIPDLRQALARYHERLFGQPSDPERFFVTVGGMHATQTAVRIVAGSGDEVLIPTPSWPNFAGALSVAGARPVGVPMTPGPSGFRLDIGRLAEAVTPRTRAIVINSPANPTGWTASRDELRQILGVARENRLWIIADEIYGRFAFDPALTLDGRTPSFRDVMTGEDRVLFVQTFSKNWAMTGWRIGWLEAPAALGDVIENLIQYSTSGVPVFAQRAAIAALEQGESFVAHQILRARQGRISSARVLPRRAGLDCPRRPARSTPSSRWTGRRIRGRSPCASSMTPMSAWLPGQPLARSSTAIFASASPARGTTFRKRCAASRRLWARRPERAGSAVERFTRLGAWGPCGPDRGGDARRLALPSLGHPRRMAFGLAHRRHALGCARLRPTDAAPRG
jgi:aspartate/methionine/tyrosine aminotransferase